MSGAWQAGGAQASLRRPRPALAWVELAEQRISYRRIVSQPTYVVATLTGRSRGRHGFSQAYVVLDP